MKSYFYLSFFVIALSFIAPGSIGGDIVGDTELTGNSAINRRAGSYVNNEDNLEKASEKRWA